MRTPSRMPYRPLPKVGPKEWPLYLKRAFVGLVLGIGVALAFVADQGCSANLPSPTPIVNSLPPLGLCVVEAAATDIVDAISDPASLIGAIVSACSRFGSATIEQIIAWVEQALSSQPAVADAGPSPASARRAKVRAAALAMQHVVVVSPPPKP